MGDCSYKRESSYDEKERKNRAGTRAWYKRFGHRLAEEDSTAIRGKVIMKFDYPYTLEKQDDGNYLVQFVDLDEAFTEGETEEAARFNACEVLSLVLEQRLDDGAAIPLPTSVDTCDHVAPQASVQSALLIHIAREDNHSTISDLARALNTSWPSAQRLENPRHSPTLKQLERASTALGKRLVLVLEDE